MPKTLKTKAELEALLLSELQKLLHCEGAKIVSVYRTDGMRARANWIVASLNAGTAGEKSCLAALGIIERRFQALYELAPDC